MKKELTNILKKATESIEGQYFQLSLDGGDPVYRERLYCYELYHQIRCLGDGMRWNASINK